MRALCERPEQAPGDQFPLRAVLLDRAERQEHDRVGIAGEPCGRRTRQLGEADHVTGAILPPLVMSLRHDRLELLDRYPRIATIRPQVTAEMVDAVRAAWRDLGREL